jgi:hypothetical protein
MDAFDQGRDTLFLLQAGFEDPAYPGKKFFCSDCTLLDGLLTSFPLLAQRMDVIRIAWPRPRDAVIAIVGEDNQSLPLLVLANGVKSKYQTGTFHGRNFISDKNAILAALAERHGFPNPHP